MALPPDPMVSTEWLAERLTDSRLRIVDASWHMPADNRDAAAEYRTCRIQGAVFFDIDAIADTASPLPHMLPTPDDFGRAMGSLGIGNGDTVVVYDSRGIWTAPRVWWTFRVFGHADVHVLDGGLPRWRAEGRPTDSGPPTPTQPVHFTAAYDPSLVKHFDEMHANLEHPSFQVIDARSAGRFSGSMAEPRPGLRAGHIPVSVNLPFGELVDSATGTLLPPEALRARFQAAGVDPSRPLATSCGSGVTAAVLALGLYRIGRSDVAVYDGSWSEWGGREDAPVATGPSENAR